MDKSKPVIQSTARIEHDIRNNKCIANKVEMITDHHVLWTWYPQMGGYHGHARITLEDNGCFDVEVYHDGEFPSQTVETEFHACSPLQFIEFGLNVLEAHTKHTTNDRIEHEHTRDSLWTIRNRISALLDKV